MGQKNAAEKTVCENRKARHKMDKGHTGLEATVETEFEDMK